MKVRIEMEIDMASGVYDVRFHNITRPGDDIDVHKLGAIVARVLDNVANKTESVQEMTSEWGKADIN